VAVKHLIASPFDVDFDGDAEQFRCDFRRAFGLKGLYCAFCYRRATGGRCAYGGGEYQAQEGEDGGAHY
jgi:hypothetical protein